MGKGRFITDQGWQGGLICLKKAGLNRMDKTGFFQTIFEKIRLNIKKAPKGPEKNLSEALFATYIGLLKTHYIYV